MNKQIKILILKYILVFATVVIYGDAFGQAIAKKGVIDLTNIDFSKNKIVKLSGEWEAYPNKLIEPKEFNEIPDSLLLYQKVPFLKESYLFNRKNKSLFCATYRVKIKINKDVKNLAVRIKRIETSYNLWIDNSLIISAGKPGTNEKNTVPAKINVEKSFITPKSEFYITIQVSNFHFQKGGIIHDIELGSVSNILLKTKKAKGIEIFLMGALIVMAFVHFGLFILRKSNVSLIYFSLLLFFELLHTVLNGEVFFTYLFPESSWFTLIQLDYISNYLILAFAILFFRSVFYKYISKIITNIILVYSLLMSIIVLFTKVIFFSKLLITYEIVALLTIIYIITNQIKALINKQDGALYTLLGMFFLLAAAVNDILHEMVIIHTFYTLSLGFFVFIIFQSQIISINLSKLFAKNETLNESTLELDELRNRFLSKSSFDLTEPIKILAMKYNANRAMIISYKENKPAILSVFPNNEKYEQQKFPQNLFDKLIKSKKSIIVKDSYSSELYDKEYLDKYKTKSSVSVTLHAQKDIMAVVYLENDNKFDHFTKKNVNIIELLTNQILGFIFNSEIYNKLENLNKNLGNIIKQRTADVTKQRAELEKQRNEIESKNKSLENVFDEITSKNKSIKESIDYTKNIQKAMLPKDSDIHKIFNNYFIFYKPKEIVSGDLYWTAKISNNKIEKCIFSTIDCTGHGIPGALMSFIATGLLDEAVYVNKLLKPSDILDDMQKNIKKKMHQGKNKSDSKDGMDLSLIVYEPSTNILEYAGARNNAYIFKNNEFYELKSDRMSIGGVEHARVAKKRFTNHALKIETGDILYLFSDGFLDQTGGEYNRKFMRQRFQSLLQEIHTLPLKTQKEQLSNILKKWKGNNPQLDDILITGIKF